MAIYDLTVIKSKGGTTFVCSKCQVPGLAAMGATDKADLRHLLICPKCSLTMGEWLTIEHRDQELKALAAKLARPA
jgi:hypothetical protein